MVPLKRISMALGVLALTAAPALAQGVAPGRNQATADRVAGVLRPAANLSGSRVSIESRDGRVLLSGVVTSVSMKAAMVAQTRQVAGVTGVVDRLQVVGDGRVQAAQFQPTQVAMGGHPFGHGHGGGAMGGGLEGSIVHDGVAGYDGGPIPEGGAGSGATQAAVPGYPNYAWPSYAPYPNFSAVGYPTVYPWQAWPNIGPFYPYPEVPLDWRAVTLRWDDGLWWLDFKKHYTRPFITPYPFGIFGY